MRLATLTLLVASAAAVEMHLTTGDFHTYPGYAGNYFVEHGSVDFFKGEHDGEDAVHFQLELRLNDGMCGDYHSVIGMEKAEPLRRFVTGMVKGRFTPATEEATLSGLYIETDDATGKAVRVEMVRNGGRLQNAAP